jgi:hypothetical protein
MKTNIDVKFVFTKEFNEVTAVFINKYTEFLDCYSHIGQHSLCSKDWVFNQKPATKKQYQNLLNELQNIGYNVNVLN